MGEEHLPQDWWEADAAVTTRLAPFEEILLLTPSPPVILTSKINLGV
jgi:hypothetical protein